MKHDDAHMSAGSGLQSVWVALTCPYEWHQVLS